jgi:predicted transposase YbfD/YdcC
MASHQCLTLTHYFITLKDPRVAGRTRHRFLDLITIALCAVLAGANDWHEVAVFARRRHAWLAGFLPLPHGVPAHDTFERLFARIDPHRFGQCFARWVAAVGAALGIKHIALDGKTLRGSRQRSTGLGPLHVVSAWSTEAHLSLGEVRVADQANEIVALPKLLQLLDLQGALVTVDAMGSQKEVARLVVDGGGDYIFTIKGNQPHLLEDIQNSLQKALDSDDTALGCDQYTTQERGHGREESRRYTILHNPEGIRGLQEWAGLHTIGLCHSECVRNGKTTEEIRYFIGSLAGTAQEYAAGLRDHWKIENCLHWQLDVTFREDDSRVRQRQAAENFGLLRRLALSMLQRHPAKQSVAKKRYEAALDPCFLEEIFAVAAKAGKL